MSAPYYQSERISIIDVEHANARSRPWKDQIQRLVDVRGVDSLSPDRLAAPLVELLA